MDTKVLGFFGVLAIYFFAGFDGIFYWHIIDFLRDAVML